MKILAAYYKPTGGDPAASGIVPAFRLVLETNITQHRFVAPQPTLFQVRQREYNDRNTISIKITSDRSLLTPRPGEEIATGIVFSTILQIGKQAVVTWGSGLLFIADLAIQRASWEWTMPSSQEAVSGGAR
jgi:hypothetical protein